MNLRMDGEGLSTVLESIGDGVIIADRERRVTFMNRAAGVMTGCRPEEALGRPLHDVFVLVKDKTARKTEDPVAAAVERGVGESLGIHVPLIAKDGTRLAICGTCAPMRDDKGNIHGASVVFRDSSECKQIEDTLRLSEEKYKRIVENSRDVIMLTQSDGIISYISPACTEVLGWASEDLVGKQPWIVHPDDLVKVKELHCRALMGESGTGFEYRVGTKTGSIKWISHSWSPEFTEGRVQEIVSIMRDISEQKRLQEQIFQAQKMESVATLAGGIAHDFNNLMATVLGYASLLRMELGNSHPADKSLSVIEESASRAGALARQLLAYAREGKCEPQVLILNEIVRGAIRFCEHLIPPNIRLELDLDPSVPNILADPTQMHQVVMNLCTNGIEAMPDGGRIAFRTRGVRFSKRSPNLPEGLAPGSYVSLRIRDTGCGMDKATLARVFEPFFTTQFVGRGLGLAAIHGIVTNHGGVVSVESEIGKGTTFTVYLPATKQALKKTEPLKAGTFRGNETILIIDDEPSILNITERILQRFGYQILLATSGEEALELAQNYKGTIHLALLDLSMPRLAGTETYPRLAALRPDMKVIISTGYTLDEPAQRLLKAGAQGFIQKPYTIDGLARRVREILDGE